MFSRTVINYNGKYKNNNIKDKIINFKEEEDFTKKELVFNYKKFFITYLLFRFIVIFSTLKTYFNNKAF